MGAPRNIVAAAPGLPRLIQARANVAQLVALDPVYLPIFERLDAEVQTAEAAQMRDPVYLARLMAEQRRSA